MDCEFNYGRVGCKGRSLITLFDSQKDAQSYVKQALKRRQSSPQRIGVAYESVYSSPSFAWKFVDFLILVIMAITVKMIEF